MVEITEKPMVEPISMKNFNKLPKTSKLSPQMQAIRDMLLNSAMILSHEGIRCGKKSSAGCSLNASLSIERRQSGRQYISRHLPDGRIAVACVKK